VGLRSELEKSNHLPEKDEFVQLTRIKKTDLGLELDGSYIGFLVKVCLSKMRDKRVDDGISGLSHDTIFFNNYAIFWCSACPISDVNIL